MYIKFGWVWSNGLEFSFLTLPPFWRGWKIESLDFWNFSFVCVTKSTSMRNIMMLEWLEVPYRFWWPVSEWVPKWAIFSGQYLRIYLSCIYLFIHLMMLWGVSPLRAENTEKTFGLQLVSLWTRHVITRGYISKQ